MKVACVVVCLLLPRTLRLGIVAQNNWTQCSQFLSKSAFWSSAILTLLYTTRDDDNDLVLQNDCRKRMKSQTFSESNGLVSASNILKNYRFHTNCVSENCILPQVCILFVVFLSCLTYSFHKKQNVFHNNRLTLYPDKLIDWTLGNTNRHK